MVVFSCGCIASPLDQPIKQDTPVRFIANNSDTTDYTFHIYVVQRPANVTYEVSDGRTGNSSISEGISNIDPGDNRTFTSVKVPDSARLHERLRVDPGESAQTNISSNLPRNLAVVVAVYDTPNQIISFVTANCDDLALAGLRVTTHHRETSVTHSCREI